MANQYKLSLNLKEIIEADYIEIVAMENKSLSGIFKWDEKQETLAMYISKLEALAEFHDSGDALDSIAMANCATKSEYEGLTLTDADDLKKAILYQQNKCGCAIMMLRQSTIHRLTAIVTIR